MNAISTWSDPIVAEIHGIRERLAQEYENDLYAYSQAAESHCQTLGFDFVESPRRQLIPPGLPNQGSAADV